MTTARTTQGRLRAANDVRLVPPETGVCATNTPEDIAILSAAYDAVLEKLRLVDHTDPLTLTVAKLIIEFAKEGERDPPRLCDRALNVLSK